MGQLQDRDQIPSEVPAWISYYIGDLKDGFGQIQLIAKILVEVTGLENPKRIKYCGGLKADAVAAEERYWVGVKSGFARRGVSYKCATAQDVFDSKAQEMAEYLVETAQGEGWCVTNNRGLPQKTPRVSGYVDVQLVLDFFVKARSLNQSKFLSVLKFILLARPADCGPVKFMPSEEELDTRKSCAQEPQTVCGIGEPNAQINSTKGKRKHRLASIIDQAKSAASDAKNWMSVWDALVEIASAEEVPRPLLGYVHTEGIKYMPDTSETPAFFTRNAFRRHFQRKGRG